MSKLLGGLSICKSKGEFCWGVIPIAAGDCVAKFIGVVTGTVAAAMDGVPATPGPVGVVPADN
jgi:hypothetical protein